MAQVQSCAHGGDSASMNWIGFQFADTQQAGLLLRNLINSNYLKMYIYMFMIYISICIYIVYVHNTVDSKKGIRAWDDSCLLFLLL